jgi:hypothetical protein
MAEKYQTVSIEDTEMIYSLLREKFPGRQIQIEYNDNTKEYTLSVTDELFKEDPEVPLDIKIKIVYGDSVTSDTPLLLKNPITSQIHIETISKIFDEKKSIEYPGFKMFDKTLRLEKAYSITDFQVWTDIGWQNIKKVIRHKTDKKIYKVSTDTSVVKVTEDHSLLDENKNILKPIDCNTESRLLTSYPNCFNQSVNSISKNKAFIYGFFYSNGIYDYHESIWELNATDLNVLNILKDLLEKEYKNSLIATVESYGLYKYTLTVNDSKDLINEYKSKFYDNITNNKKVPIEILNSNNEIIQSFLDGYNIEKGSRKDTDFFEEQIGSAGLYYLMKKLGHNNVSLNTINDKTRDNQQIISNKIKKIELQELTNDFVYDLETDCGRFQAGVGDIIVKNTDSIFIKMKFNRDDHVKNREDTFKLATICGDNLTNDIFNRHPIVLEFEKVFQPFVLLTKKRYIGNKFENMKDPFKMKETTTAGIAITRRDFCNMVKKCYKEIIDVIMSNKSNSLENAVEIYKSYIDRIENYQIDLDNIIVSAQIGKEYSCKNCKKKTEWILKCDKCHTLNPQAHKICQGMIKGKPCKKVFECVHTFSLGHINLAQRMLYRNEQVQVGDRIQYLLVETNDPKAQKSELAEDPVYFQKNKLKYNRGCYLEQLGKTILAFFKITLKDNQYLLDDAIQYTNEKLLEVGAKKLKPSDYKIDEE